MKHLMTLLLILALALTLPSCIRENQQEGQDNQPEEIEQPADTAITVTGIAVDGAMNSVYLKVGDDTIEFTYPDLDTDHRASWDINDTLTVRYYESENGDSVTEVINGSVS